MHGLVHVVHHIRTVCDVTFAIKVLHGWWHYVWSCTCYCHDYRKTAQKQRKSTILDNLDLSINILNCTLEHDANGLTSYNIYFKGFKMYCTINVGKFTAVFGN